MNAAQHPLEPGNPITDNMDVWTSAILKKSASGRGSNSKQEAYGIKKLRELILELAVRGKLVSQDPSDEPASELLRKVSALKQKLIKEKRIKKQKTLQPISKEEKLFELPHGWEWVRLGEFTSYGISDKAEAKDVTASTWVLELEDVEKETSRLLQKKRFSEREFKSSKNRFLKGDVIYGKLRPYLDKVLVADEDGVCTTEMIPVRAYCGMTPEFLRLVMKSPYFKEYANNSTHGMNLPRMGTDKARLAIIPCIPENEQHRIIAKVDELMALCDQLEQQQTDNIQAHQILVETLLGTLTRVESSKEFTEAWNRIANHFDTLLTTEHSIDQLKQTILQLAVMGKLAPQDPNDEPAMKLLEKIAKEKEQQIKMQKIKKQKALLPISEEDKPFRIPEGWVWSRIGDASITTAYGLSDKATAGGEGVPVLAMGHIQSGSVLLDAKTVVQESVESLPELYLEHRDLLYNRTNSAELVGKTGIFLGNDNEHTFASYLIRIRTDKHSMLPEFININMLSPVFRETQIVPHLKQQCGQANVNGTIMKNMLVAIPPAKEQLRIVSKVDELMTLCETLKTRINNAQTTQLHLADAIVERAVDVR